MEAVALSAATTTFGRSTASCRMIPKSSPVRLNSEVYAQLWTEVLRRDAWRCQSCGARTNLQVHHIQHRSQGRQDTTGNLITLCAKCHRDQHSGQSAS